ncbi:MAG: dermonecrotic toxin domain-containing protein, partial [Pseudomonas sp.]
HVIETFNVQRWMFIAGHREPVINAQPVGAHLTQVVYADVPLLEAALRNFTAEEATAQGQPRGNRLTSARQGRVKPPSAVEFAGICRTLDLGGQYQHHLDNVLLSPTPDGQSVATLLGDLQRHEMLIDAYKARLNNVLTEDELQLILGLYTDGTTPRLQGKPVVAKQLRLLGCNLEQIVVLDVIDEGLLRNTTARVLVHVPGDPHGAWSAFTSLRRLANDLGRRLRTEAYQRFFSRFVRRRDSQRFYSTIIPAYADLADWANYDLEEHMYAYHPPLFDTLGDARIKQMKDDAAMIAVPVSDLDRAVQQAHDQRLAAEGWALLNLAGFFVPVIGAALLAVTAWELLGEVYHGVEAWREGDSSEALDHLVHVATDIAVMGVTAVGIGVAQRLWARSAEVDKLVPAELEDGTRRLCSPTLQPYRSLPPPAEASVDEAGVHRFGDQSWVEMDGHCYPVVQRAADNQWQLRPRAGYGPRLCHNGAGAWRLWYEQPAQWDDTYRLFRRLGGRFRELSDEQIDQVLQAHGMRADHLRALHVEGRAPEAALVDSVLRFRLDQRIRDVIGALRGGEHSDDVVVVQHVRSLPAAHGLADSQLADLAWRNRRLLFQRVYDAMQASSTEQTGPLRRSFTSLHEPAARELLRNAAASDRQQLVERARVPLRLAEAARAQVSCIRQARVFEAFYLDTPQNADLARIALAMLEHLPGGTMMRWRLFEGGIDGPHLLTVGEGPG